MTSITIKEYIAERGSIYSNKDAAMIGPVLRSLSEQGGVTARDVLDTARSKNSPLHSYFLWDDKVAADEFRLEQARRMMRSIRIRYVDGNGIETKEARAFQIQRTSSAYDREPRRYRTFQVLHGDTAFAAQMMDSAIDDLMNWKHKYEPYCSMWANFGDVFQQVINQADEFAEEARAQHIAGETDEAVARLLAWKEECADILATWTAAREQVEYIMKAIGEAEAVFAEVNERKERTCLKCRRPFMSVSVGNRVCKACLNSKTVNERNVGIIDAKIAG